MHKIFPFLAALFISATISPINNISHPEHVDPRFSFIGDPDLPSLPPIDSLQPISDSYLYCDTFGPFPLSAPDFYVTFKYRVMTLSTSIIERIRLFNSSGTVVASSNIEAHTYSSNTLQSATFLVPIHDYWTKNGLTLNFQLLNGSSYTIIKDYSVTFYPPSSSNKSFSYSSLKKETYETRPIGFKGNGKDLVPVTEKYDFTHLGDYFIVDYYYKLKINELYFFYDSYFSFTYNNMTLRFKDNNSLFPYMSHDAESYIYIRLKPKRENNRIFFQYQDKFYINKRTLQISDEYRSGFVMTNDFYLPINGKKQFVGKSLYIDLLNIGNEPISTTISLKYDTDKAYVGLCDDGENCVIGGRR